MTNSIQEDTIRYIFNIEKEVQIQRKQVANPTSTSHGDGDSGSKPVVKKERVGRNDPCPCGSGEKYKKCCGR
ncbi:MAG: hypothetical protein GX968_06495, partial [Tissierellia bacterium]|nr:hypothetical protein [Tissierellia bacterium]